VTKQELRDQVSFALSELADCHHELSRIYNIPFDDRRPGEMEMERVARTLGRAEAISKQALLYLDLAIDTLRVCLPEEERRNPIIGLLTSSPLPASEAKP